MRLISLLLVLGTIMGFVGCGGGGSGSGTDTVSTEGNSTEVSGGVETGDSTDSSPEEPTPPADSSDSASQMIRVDISYFGEGEISSSGDDFECTGRGFCSGWYSRGEEVTFEANAGANWEFLRWQGCDQEDANRCSITVDQRLLLSATFTNAATLKVANDVVVLSKSQQDSILSFDQNSGEIVFDLETDRSGLNPGVILVSGNPEEVIDASEDGGHVFAARVVDVVERGGELLISSVPVGVGDVLAGGFVDFTHSINVSDLPQDLPEGVSLGAGPRALNNVYIPLELNLTLYDHDGDSETKYDQVLLDGSLEIQVSVERTAYYDDQTGEIAESRIVLSKKSKGKFSITNGAVVSFKKDWIPAEIPLPPITVGPIVILQRISPYLSIDFDVNVGLEPEINIYDRSTRVVHYINGEGYKTYETESPVTSFDLKAPLPQDALNLKAKTELGLGVKYRSIFYQLAEASIGLEAYGGGAAKAIGENQSEQVCGWDWLTYMGVRGTAEAETILLSNGFGNYEVKLFEIKHYFEPGSRGCSLLQANVPVVPYGLQVVSKNSASVTFTWELSDSAEFRAGSSIYRDGSPLMSRVDATTFTDKGLKPDTEYCYTVRSVDMEGKLSEVSNQLCVVTDSEDTIAPAPPPFVYPYSNSQSSIGVQWEHPVDHQDVEFYEISMSPAPSTTPYYPVAMVDGGELIASVTGLSPGQNYCVQMVSIDNVGNRSPASAPSCATTLSVEEPEVSGIPIRGTTELISFLGENEGSGYWVEDASISHDGDYAVIRLRGNGKPSILYWRNLKTGDERLPALGMDGEPVYNVGRAKISGDGNVVVFQSTSRDLVPGDTNSTTQPDLFLKNISQDTIERVSVTSSGEQVSGSHGINSSVSYMDGIDLSDDGRYVVYVSSSVELDESVNPEDNDAVVVRVIYLYDSQTKKNKLVSGPLGGLQNNEKPCISPDGRYIGFSTKRADLDDNAVDDNDDRDWYLYDTQAETHELITIAIDGGASEGSSLQRCDISEGGRYVVFDSSATDLVEDRGFPSSVYLRDRQEQKTYLISTPVENPDGADLPSISNNGRYISFLSDSEDIVDDKVGGTDNVFVYDREAELFELVGVDENNDSISSQVFFQQISGDGKSVLFITSDDSVTPEDPHGNDDAYVHRLDVSP